MKFPTLNLGVIGVAAAAVTGSASAFVAPSSATFQQSATALGVKARGEGYGPPLDNISEAVGNTPMVKISDRLCPPGR